MVAIIISMMLPLVSDDLPAGAVARLGSTRWRTVGSASCQCFFHPDGKRLIRVGGYEGTACVLDIATGKIIQRLETDDQRMQHGALSHDGRWLACLGSRSSPGENSRTVSQGTHVFELATGAVVRSWSEQSQSKIALSADGSLIARCIFHANGGEHVHVSNVTTGAELLKWRKGDNNGVLSLQLSDKGDMLAIVKYSHELGKSMTVYLVDTATQETIIERPLPRTANITYHSIDAGFRWLAYYDRTAHTILVEDLRTGRPVKRLPFTPSARAKIAAPGKAVPDDDGPSVGCVFSADDSRLVVAEGAFTGTNSSSIQLLLFDLSNDKQLQRWDREHSWQGLPAISRDNSTIACGGRTNAINLYDTATGKLLNPVVRDNPPGDIRTMAFSPDGKTLALAGHDNCIDTWDATTWTRRARWKTPPMAANAMACSPDGKRLLLGGFANDAQIWDIASQKQVLRFRALNGYVTAVAWLPDGKTVAIAGMAEKGSLALIDATTGKELTTHAAVGSNSSFFSQQSEYWTNSFQLIQTRTGRVLTSLVTSQSQPIYKLVYSHQSLFAFNGQRQMAMYERATLKHRWRMDDGGWIMAFSRDGRYVAYGEGWNRDVSPRTIIVRDAVTGEVRCQWVGHAGMQTACFSPDDSHVLSAGSDGTVLVWKLPTIPTPAPWNAAEAEKAWKQLESEDAVAGALAVAFFIRYPTQAVPWLAERLPPVAAPDRESMQAALEKLNHAAFQVRQKAYDQLKKQGKLAEPLLKQQLEKTNTPETQRRIESLLNDIEGMQLTATERQALRAVEIVDRINTEPATALLARWAQGAPGARLTELASECHQVRAK